MSPATKIGVKEDRFMLDASTPKKKLAGLNLLVK